MKKKTVLLLLAALLVGGAATAQKSNRNNKGKKKDETAIVGRQKIRQSDYATYDRFTQFSTKDPNRYYTPFDYGRIRQIATASKPDWRELQPVVNYLESSKRAQMLMCALYAVNPDIDDPATRARLAKQAEAEALKSVDRFNTWKLDKEMRNKMQYRVAEVDYRYFKGAEYYNNQTDDSVIHVGLLLYFGTKKIKIIDVDTTARHFDDVKFFPHDATIQDSWYAQLDTIAQYLKENDRKGILLLGYSDNQGTDDYNRGLSRQRATEIKKALVSRGISPERIEIEAKGTDDPIGDNRTYEGRIANNRVAIKIQ